MFHSMIHRLATHPVGAIFLAIWILVYIIAAFCSFRLVKVGAKKFDREAKDFFTSDSAKMLRKLES